METIYDLGDKNDWIYNEGESPSWVTQYLRYYLYSPQALLLL